MAEVIGSISETQRMELRALIRLASEVIAYYWPMRTFVHHNPLHGLEELHFEKAVRRGKRLLGAQPYLSNDTFRDYFRRGRISSDHVDAALRTHAGNEQVTVGTQTVSRFEVQRIHLTQGIAAPPAETLARSVESHSHGALISSIAGRLLADSNPGRSRVTPPKDEILEEIETVSAWCDHVFGTEIDETINRELVKWCEAFLDEGHAAWPMPAREQGFYAAWRFLAAQEWSPCGIRDHRQKLSRLPANSEASLMESLTVIGINRDNWQEYLSLHLAALPGWAGFIRWRADQNEYEWQLAYPIDLPQYLAVRLWYERELVQQVCRERLGIDGNLSAISAEIRQRKDLTAFAERKPAADRAHITAAWKLIHLAQALQIDPAVLVKTPTETLSTIIEWLEYFSESEHGPIWLKAFEAGYREELLSKLEFNFSSIEPLPSEDVKKPQQQSGGVVSQVRPQAQAVFCIDVRSEPFRRHLEAAGDYETYGFAGFFAAFIRHQALGSHHETDQFPVIMKSKNLVREIPRSYHGRHLFQHRHREKLLETGHTLLYDLKENVVTPYVMVESLGWFYSLPLLGKTVLPRWYRAALEWVRRKIVPPIATTLTVEKLAREEVVEMIAAEQRAITRRALQKKFGDRNLNLSIERMEFLRRRALNEFVGEPSPRARAVALTPEEETIFIEELRQHFGINQGAFFARMERITRTGFTLGEQIFTVETVLRVMGLTRNFARLVLFCGHGSSSENNPFEAALDCGACGGNSGKPNARVLATMANRPLVREQLAKNGIEIPQDTYFIAGLHNTTTDEVELFDLEDLPPTHRKDLLQFVHDLETAGARTGQERYARFPEGQVLRRPSRAKREIRRRSADWSQVRPEWGLSGNAAFIIGRRALTRGIQLAGRVFLHSYDYREDPDGKLLEVIMTGPQVVGQWINMEHYFSTVDQDVYGSGSKIYHNVVGRFGIMSGPQSDLRTGLAAQTVMNGSRPYHEAMRLLTLIEAPRGTIEKIVRNQRHLQELYDNEWVSLIAIEPEERRCYRYVPKIGWTRIETRASALELKRC
ncbi:MAG TPA: DUF2309 domain-containing protein [Candidatus Binatia bacterium]